MSDPLTVLLVDDDHEIACAASVRLTAAGYQTITAHDGKAAVISASSSLPSAIVLDVRMPVQDGLVTLAELKKKPETMDIPVIMLSASIGDQQAALDAGAKYFLRKPYRGELLIEAVNAVIAAQSLRTTSNGNDERNANPPGAELLTASVDLAAPHSNQLNRGRAGVRKLVSNLFDVNSSPVEGLLARQRIGH